MMHATRTILAAAMALAWALAVPTTAQTFDLAEVADRFAKAGRPPGYHPGPGQGYGAPAYGPHPRPPGPVPGDRFADEALVTQLVVMLVGHADYDLQRGAEIYTSDRCDKHLNFLAFTADKVVAALELDRQDGTLAPVIEAVEKRDAALISEAVLAMHAEVTSGLSADLGPEYLWYYEVGQNISRIEFAIWEQTHFNLLGFIGESADPGVQFRSPPAGGNTDLARLMQAFTTGNGQGTDLVGLFEDYMALRDYIAAHYGFEGAGLILW